MSHSAIKSKYHSLVSCQPLRGRRLSSTATTTTTATTAAAAATAISGVIFLCSTRKGQENGCQNKFMKNYFLCKNQFDESNKTSFVSALQLTKLECLSSPKNVFSGSPFILQRQSLTFEWSVWSCPETLDVARNNFFRRKRSSLFCRRRRERFMVSVLGFAGVP